MQLRTEEPGTLRLSDAKSRVDYVVTRIPDEDFPLLRYLVSSRILPGERVSVEDVAGYRGVVDILRDDAKVSLSMDVAARIRVRPA